MINTIIQGDALEVLKKLPDNFVDLICTSPPYWGQRNYYHENQLGIEKTPADYLEKLYLIFRECYRVLKVTGSCFIVIDDIHKDNSLLLLPYKLAEKLQKMYLLRNILIWHKPNAIPESITNRFAIDYEPILFLTKSKDYYFETQFEPYSNLSEKEKVELVKKNLNLVMGRIKRSVWNINTVPFSGKKYGFNVGHYATYPKELVEVIIQAACPEKICSKCGFIREKIVERVGESSAEFMKNKNKENYDSEQGKKQNLRADRSCYFRPVKFKYKSCNCNEKYEPGIVLDPFCGSGTTCLVAKNLGRNFIGIEINSDYVNLANKRLSQEILKF